MAMTASSRFTLADHIFPLSRFNTVSLLRDTLLVVSFSIFVALCAQISFRLPNTPVPVTLQTLGVLLTGATLGSRRGGLALLTYLAEGAAGLPVFAEGYGGIARLIGPTAGYLWSFPIAASITGWLCEKGLDRTFTTSALAMLPGSVSIYLLGVPWLALVLKLSLPVALTTGMLPFLLGDVIKLFVASALLPATWQLTKWDNPTKGRRA
jgi:biotin transport system substrate-specific component